MGMAGAVCGVLIRQVLPNWLFLGLAGLILGMTCWKTSIKFKDAYKREKENHRKKNENKTLCITKEVNLIEDVSIMMEDSECVPDTENSQTSFQDNSMLNESSEKKQARINYLQQDSQQYPMEKLGSLLTLWIGLTILTFFKGGKGVSSILGITCSSPTYPVLITLQFLWTLSFATYFGLKLIKNQEKRVQVNYPILPNDILWTYPKLKNYAIITLIAGIIAGLIGIGGGMVLGPLMLVMGVHPRVSSATTATMIVCTSSSVAIMYVTSGLVPWSYAAWFFSLCCLGSITGKQKIDGYVKKTGMASLLI